MKDPSFMKRFEFLNSMFVGLDEERNELSDKFWFSNKYYKSDRPNKENKVE